MEKLTRRGREMQRLMARWERSGLTMAEFARRRGMSPHTFAWWRHRLRAASAERAAEAGGVGAAKFTEVAVARMGRSAEVMEVVLRSGRMLRGPLVGVDPVALRTLVRVLEERC
jgi:hypothetical protein